MRDTNNFFSTLPDFDEFLGFANRERYRPAPDTHWVLITDVRGSTRAIEEGRYKEVNYLGAASIAALVNTLGTHEFPFVFGGDGATAILSPERLDQVKASLRAVQKMSKEGHDLDLRVGLVPLAHLYKEGAQVWVARYRLPGGPSLAFFDGTGLGMAEAWVKSGKYLLESEGPIADERETLKGLSCRWAPMPSRRGKMLSILVKSQAVGPEAIGALTEIAAKIHEIVDLDSPEANPVSQLSLIQEPVLKVVNHEVTNSKKGRFATWIKVFFEMIAVRVLRHVDVKVGTSNVHRYLNETASHSDFRKYDEVLRMVVDCTPAMQKELGAYLEHEYKNGKIFYGVHASDSALMTCFVQTLEPGRHIHFIDGSDGGYALAAKGLKAQISGKGAVA